METTVRRYDIDWLRVIAIGLLLIYHIAIVFQPWAAFIGFMQSNTSLEWLWIPMSMLNVWRIPLLFFVSGMGVCFAMRKRNWKQLIVERTKRILIPFIFGVIFIVPIHIYLWQSYYSQDIRYVLSRSHLWFLANIFAYVILLLPLFYYLKKNTGSRLNQFLNRVLSKPLGLLIVIIPFIIEAEVIKPVNFELYAMTWHGFFLGLIAFLFGYIFIYCGMAFWPNILKWRWQYLTTAIILFIARYNIYDLKAPDYLTAVESNFWIFSILGFAYKHLNKPGKALSYLSKAAYPVYIIHMVFLYLGSIIILPLELSGFIKFLLVVAFTAATCMLSYELIIKRINFVRPLFGLTPKFRANSNSKTKAMRTLKIVSIKRAILILSVLSLVSISCTLESSSQPAIQPPKNINDGLSVGTLEEAKIDSKLIEKAIHKIQAGKFKEVHSMLIYKDNMLVLEEYFQGHIYQWDAPKYHGELVKWDRDMSHHIMSCTKSFVSACVGIAIEEGYIENVHQSIFDYLPDHQYLKTDNKEYITIEHLLTMTSGLAWNEWGAAHGTAANDIDRLYFECEDPIACVLERPWWKEPGQLFTYNGGGIVILAEIIKNASNMNIDEFSMKYLFTPLGIDSTEWCQYKNGMYDAGGSLKIRPRDMLKLGVTYLNDGMWNEDRVIPSEWVKKSSQVFNNNKDIKIPIEDSGKNGYAYTWWTSELAHGNNTIQMYRANGWGGQAIMVFPELEMVVVFTGGNYKTNSSLFKLVKRYILPAVQ